MAHRPAACPGDWRPRTLRNAPDRASVASHATGPLPVGTLPYVIGAAMSHATDGPAARHPNRLAAEKSPYLLQHADNPVDWYPWGDEAFTAAAARDRPIFLSIGYSTCHWCHVMAHESFEDPIVAALMNEAFVNVKVDREERPDVDQVYMTVCQMMTGSGGWPLTVIMTPDRRPFFAATYIPRTSRMGRTGMLDLVPRVQQLWSSERDRLTESADAILGHLRSVGGSSSSDELDLERVLADAHRQLAARYDAVHGGFGTAPKFPSPHNLIFLLRYAASHDDTRAQSMVFDTLAAMRRGGIFDQIGFGFHRYSTDAEWRLPHFEKMLYDQAMHLLAVTEAYERRGEASMARTASEIMTYVLRDMRSADGAFSSAEDADSEGEEGRFYVWTLDELRAVLGTDDAAFAARVWGCTAEGNFADEATGRRTGANVLLLQADVDELPGRFGVEPQAFGARLESIRARLFGARDRRVHPLKDDKVLADWNGLMAAAAARAGRVFGCAEWIEAAGGSVEFVTTRLRSQDGRLMHRYRDGEVAVPAFLDGYAFVLWAHLELYDATFDPSWLVDAIGIADAALQDFWNDERGGFHFTSDRHERLPVRHADGYDGAMPSGNSVMADCLARLARLTGRTEYETRASATIDAFARDLQRAPSGHTHMLRAVMTLVSPSLEVVVAGAPGVPGFEALVSAVRDHAPPEAAVLVVPPGPEGDPLRRAAPFVEEHAPVEGRAAAYVCRDFACRLPTGDPGELVQLLGAARGGNGPDSSPKPPASTR